MQIDFGGIGKEYAVDRATALVRSAVDAIVCSTSAATYLQSAPRSADAPGLSASSRCASPPAQPPRSSSAGALATSGDARRYLLKNGKRYSHILDPTTGWPVEGAPRSVTVAAPTCTGAGMLATLALLQGRNAEAFLAAQQVQHWCSTLKRDADHVDCDR